MSKKNNKTDVVMTERQRAEAKEAKSLKIMTFSFVIIVVLCLSILVGSVAITPIKNVIYKNTKAITIGNETLSAVQLNYFYVDAISNYLNGLQSSYGDYWYLFAGIDTTKPLDKQTCTYTEDEKEVTKTWADRFLDVAVENATSTYELYRLAQEEGFKLSESGQKQIDSTLLTMGFYASYYGFKNMDGYLANSYGNGATEESYREYYTICRIAQEYYAHYAESLEYDEEAISAYDRHEDHVGIYNSYTYNYYMFSATAFREGGTKDDKGNMTYTDEEKKAAIETAKKLADELAAGTYEDVEAFDKALNEILKAYEDSKKVTTSAEETTAPTNPSEPTDPTEPSTPSDDKEDEKEDDKKEEDKNKKSSTKADDVLGSKANSLFLEWLAEADRAEGDLKVFEVSTGEGDNKVISGYYVVRYESTNDNLYELVNVRHLLVKFEGGKYNSTTGKTTYTDTEKKAAKTEAERLLKLWEQGEKTEDTLIELIKKNSDDGNAAEGGLYEDIVPGQMVESFNDWCFDAERKVGDYGIVETEYGYHIMYFSGRSETLYRNYLITEDMRVEDATAWHEDLVEKATVTILNDKYVDKGMKLS